MAACCRGGGTRPGARLAEGQVERRARLVEQLRLIVLDKLCEPLAVLSACGVAFGSGLIEALVEGREEGIDAQGAHGAHDAREESPKSARAS